MSLIDVPEEFALDQNPITVGLLNAALKISEQNKRKATEPPKKPRYTYIDGGTMLHASRGLKREERKRFDAAEKTLPNAKDHDEIKAIL